MNEPYSDDVKVTHEWMGYKYKIGERGMYWVTKDRCNPMPGACCFGTAGDARKGIAALIIATSIWNREHYRRSVGDLFWAIMELVRK